MHVPYRRTRIALALAAAAFALSASNAYGAAFALQENSASGLGNAFAGGAAAAEDASTVWTNPAGMSLIKSVQVATAVHFITPAIKFKNSGSAAAVFQTLGDEGGDAGSTNIVPNLFVVAPITPQLAFGLGVNAPFGLVTEYSPTWIGRFQAVKSDVKTLNINPAISWAVSDRVSLGVGVDYQRIKATFTNRVNYSAAIAQAAGAAAAAGQIPGAAVPPFTTPGAALTSGLEAGARIDGDDSAWGWNAGVLFKLDANSRIGAAYRSSIKYRVSGNVNFDKPTLPALPATLAPVGGALANAVNAALFNGGVTSDIELPAIANVSYFRRVNDRWDVMADVQWTGWSSIKELRFVRTTGVDLANTPENFDDAWRLSVGANYRLNDRWMLRGGVAWDQSPVNDVDRTPRLPDQDRLWFSLGAQYVASPHLKFDIGATYIDVKNATISPTANSAGNGFLRGNYDSNYVTIFSGQVTYSF